MTATVRRAGARPPTGRAGATRSGGQALRQLLYAQALGTFGFRVMSLAMPVLAAGTLHASPFAVGAVSACQTAPFLVIGLPAGVWVDRVRRRPLMVAADAGRAVALVAIPVAWWCGVLSLALLCAVATVVGTLTVFFDVAGQSYLPHVVAGDQLVAANSALTAVEQVAGLLGPALGGLVVQLLTAPQAFTVCAAGCAGSAVFLSHVRRPEAPAVRSPGTGLTRAVREGIRYVTGDRLLRAVLLTSTTITFFWGVAYAMLLVLLVQRLHAAAATVGAVLTVGACGGVAATLCVRRLIARFGDATALKLSVLLTGPLTPAAAFASPGWGLWPAALASFALSGGIVVYNVAQISYRQRTVPPDLLGRVNATMRFVSWGARPLGALTGGALAGVVGVRGAVLAGALGTAMSCGWLYASPIRGMRDLTP